MRYMRIHVMMLGMIRASRAHSSDYLDPGTGSMFLQVILGGVAGAAVAVKMFWHQIMAILPSSARSSDESSSADE